MPDHHGRTTQQAPRHRGRTLYAVDLENMARSSSLVARDVALAQSAIAAIEPAQRGDHVVLATSHHNAEAMCFGWQGDARRLLRSGVDGADLALLEALEDPAWVAARYSRVVIASGDHVFAYAVAALKSAGCVVTVVSHGESLSRALRLAAGTDLVLIPEAAAAGTVGPKPTSKDVA